LTPSSVVNYRICISLAWWWSLYYGSGSAWHVILLM